MQQLSDELICQILKGLPKQQQVSRPDLLAPLISQKISEELRPRVAIDSFESIHDLSQEQEIGLYRY